MLYASRTGVARGWSAMVSILAVSLGGPADGFVTFGNGFASKWGPDPNHGSGAVVTWGFVPDGTTVDPAFRIDPFGSPDDVGTVGTSNVSQLRSLVDGNHGSGAFDAAIRSAFDTWSAAADIQFVQVADPGTPMAQAGSTTPDIRIGAFEPLPGHFFEGTGAVGFGPPGIVTPANDFPESGDIFFNLNGSIFGGVQTPFHLAPGDEDVTPVDFFNFGDDLEGLFLHEVGHAIGLAHPPWEGDVPDRRVMYVGDFNDPEAPPCCTAINRLLDPDDIAGAVSIYGPPAIIGDFNGSGSVEQGDLNLVLNNWGLDTDAQGVPAGWIKRLPFGTIDQAELNAVLNNWGASAAPSVDVPEPAATVLFALGLTLRRRW
ncbi:MAG: matrixin family metalloprotease [Planctomycetota bacterium]